MKKFALLTLVVGQSLFGASYIVLFKQAEVAISSLEHGGFQNLLQTANEKSVTQLEQWLGGRGEKTTVEDLWMVRGAVVTLEDASAAKLKKEPWVQGVYPDRVRKFINPKGEITVGNSLKELGEEPAMLWGLQKIGLAKIRAEFPALDGSGIRVGILDTGIQSKHAELPGTVVFKDFVNNLPRPYDDQGHGTHVSGTIAGKQVGIAPKASLLMGKIFGASGSGSDSTILRAMQWAFDPDKNPETNDYPQIVSNSWGGDLDPAATTYDLADFAPYHLALQAWIYGGIIPVFAAGNSGMNPNGFPGGLPEAFAVGATDSNGEVAEFSSRGPNLWKMGDVVLSFLKPDISAPGVKITSAYPGNKFATMAGTSMATPHVSGTIALMLQANPKLKYAAIKDILMKSAERKTDIHYGYGVMNAYEAVKLASGR